MRITTHVSLWSALLFLPLITQANTVQRCEDTAGNVTFTTLSCPDGHSRQLQRAFNAPPGSTQGLMPPSKEINDPRRARAPNKEVVIVGQREDGCGNRLSADQRRQAIINQRTPPGMTRRDVESLLGRPDRVTNTNGELRYVYQQKKGRSHTVTFDQDGCVKGKR
ncbi:outer membrane protein assembly factor BamE [Pseudomonas asturiensis]|uniref:Outer membrane protein assembly factor BamE n=1 Tax=Pseudomonas asturiensis TaxID=1190415 RepID=A0ABX6HG49_9PSED|nr:outer membrane protein assembly factor BamE [Pseudomonas asturiensis]QHF04348.1 outer membrane protein assembly factor BamE [Pseudomonas asturiensis]